MQNQKGIFGGYGIRESAGGRMHNQKMSKMRFLLTLFLAMTLLVGNQQAAAFSADTCQGTQKLIKRARAKFFHFNQAPKTIINKKKARLLLKRLKNLKALKFEQGCGAPLVMPPPQVDGEVCVQMIVCRMVDDVVKVWPDPCVAAAERPDYDSLPFC
jgi:hypothetical protein